MMLREFCSFFSYQDSNRVNYLSCDEKKKKEWKRYNGQTLRWEKD